MLRRRWRASRARIPTRRRTPGCRSPARRCRRVLVRCGGWSSGPRGRLRGWGGAAKRIAGGDVSAGRAREHGRRDHRGSLCNERGWLRAVVLRSLIRCADAGAIHGAVPTIPRAYARAVGTSFLLHQSTLTIRTRRRISAARILRVAVRESPSPARGTARGHGATGGNTITFGCLSGVIAKCPTNGATSRGIPARGGSPRPSCSACTRAARTDYCGYGVWHRRRTRRSMPYVTRGTNRASAVRDQSRCAA